jgi:hypothetical protein
MSTLTLVLLILLAVVSIAQATLLVRFLIEGRRTVVGLERLANQLVDDLTPVARDLSRATGNAAQVADVALAQVQRLDALMEEVTDSISQATGRLYEAFVPNIGRMATVTAVWRVFRRGRRVYRRLRG